MAVVEEAYRKVIDQIKFGILSPQEIRKMSVVEIQTADTYDEDGAVIPSGLMDNRLGVLEPGQRCRTCGNTSSGCPGHFGHIELAVPIIHVEFAETIYNLLQVICRNCGRILLPEKTVKSLKARMERLIKIVGHVPSSFYNRVFEEAKRNRECPYCGAKQYKIEFTKPTIFHEYAEKEGSQRLTASMIRERFERIPDEDLKLLGFDPQYARPEWMILQVLPVPPVYVRPSITLESGIRSEDDLTHKLVDIIRINQRLKENMDAGAPTLIIQDLSELLEYHVTTYFNNESSGIPPSRHRSGRALKTLSQRLKGKEGRFRSNLSGKRVDFSARTVISPDSNLDINEVGVPITVAMRLTVPEKVTPWNIERLRELVRNGPNKYPGALYIIRPDGKRVRLEFVADRDKVAEALEPGFIVERHLQDGDIVIFNRQPSLHRMSIMAHYVKVLPYKTFRLHLCVCPPYNADFDGDEMNLHVPQSEEAQTEARLLMQVQDHILSPRFGGPIIGAIRDFITASFLLTRKSTLLNKKEVCELLAAAGYEGELPEPAIKEPKPLWTGKQIFSFFLPKGFNYTVKASVCRNCEVCLKDECSYDAYVIIKDGVLVKGVIDKNSIGAEKSESVLHRIIKDYGTEAGRRFLNQISRLLTRFISMKGFTYSFDELDLSAEAKRKIRQIIKSAEKRIESLTKALHEGTLERLPGQTLLDSFELYVMNELAEAREKAGKAAEEDLETDNAGIIMTKTGARGSTLNIGQMTAILGQQSIRGKRVIRGYSERSLPHFRIGDPSPKARGFVYSSYRDGLDPIEFFFHAMGGREGLVDTAVRTQQSGYMQRRLINALEHLRVEYDGTVRNPLGEIIQFNYGEDGVDPAKSDHGKAVNISRLIEQVKLMVEAGEAASNEYIEEQVNKVKDELTPLLTSELIEGLKNSNLTKKGVDLVISLALERYKKALVEPGEAVGVVAAQSIGEPGTQMTLRTFHYAGVREQNVTLGLPRLIEIVDARREPSTPIMTIYLDEEHRVNREKATEIAQKILYTTIEDISETTYINPETGGVIVKLNERKMNERGITIDYLSRVINIPNCSVKIEGDMIFIEPKKKMDSKKLLSKVLSYYIKGIAGIKRVYVTQEKGEWVIRTDGSNLPRVLEVIGVDPARTKTNNIHEIERTLGIEAARNMIVEEAKGVLEEQGLDVDIRHIMLVADIMTVTGSVRQIGRHGVSGEKPSVLARAAFEITVPNIVEAAIRGESDPLKGVTENVIVGQAIPIGTGLVDIYMTTPSVNVGEGEDKSIE
ncbi:MAG: DNA-directed RNA polymerase subunit A' [Candidatus Bathyarchaeia archaeon]